MNTSAPDTAPRERLAVFDALRGELLIDPDVVARELDEAIIRWYVAHPPR